jgi:hypothetical protein
MRSAWTSFYCGGGEKSGVPAMAFNPRIFGNLIERVREAMQLTVVHD